MVNSPSESCTSRMSPSSGSSAVVSISSPSVPFFISSSFAAFRATQARHAYEALGIAKHEIERGGPWQSYIETAFNVQRRMADHDFADAEDWPELVAAHARFVGDYNHQPHWAHRDRPGGR